MIITQEFFERMGYRYVRQMKNGKWIGLNKQIYTTRLVVGLDITGYDYGYCYALYDDAVKAIQQYEGEGDPIGPWIKLKGDLVRGEVMGPGAKGEI